MNNENLTFFNLNHHFCRHRNDGLYDFVLFVQYAKQEIPQRAVKQRKFWRFNVVVVYCNLLFLLLFGTFWYTLWRSRTPNQKFANFGEDSIRCVRIRHRAKYLTVPLEPLEPLFEKWWMSMISTRISVCLNP